MAVNINPRTGRPYYQGIPSFWVTVKVDLSGQEHLVIRQREDGLWQVRIDARNYQAALTIARKGYGRQAVIS